MIFVKIQIFGFMLVAEIWASHTEYETLYLLISWLACRVPGLILTAIKNIKSKSNGQHILCFY
jgi:hypothetical protein